VATSITTKNGADTVTRKSDGSMKVTRNVGNGYSSISTFKTPKIKKLKKEKPLSAREQKQVLFTLAIFFGLYLIWKSFQG
jgi:hypothetical protein